jgi:hypothetical protein
MSLPATHEVGHLVHDHDQVRQEVEVELLAFVDRFTGHLS